MLEYLAPFISRSLSAIDGINKGAAILDRVIVSKDLILTSGYFSIE
jgi:hypothetical protein